jgi:hypothetical protein
MAECEAQAAVLAAMGERAAILRFKPVLDLHTIGYALGFDPREEYYFMRRGWEKPQWHRLVDMGQDINLIGLMYSAIHYVGE